jgi:hypothetical protein
MQEQLQEIPNFINTHFTPASAAFWATVAGYVASSFVQALPDPDKESGKAYRFAYKFFHTLAANQKLVHKQGQEDKVEGKTYIFRG